MAVITQLLNIRVFLQVAFLFMHSGHHAPSCWAFSSERGEGQGLSLESDFYMHWDWFIYHFHLLLPAGTFAAVGNPSNTEQCRGVSTPCSQGGQEPTGTADTGGVANWKAGMVSSPRRCTDSIYLYTYGATSSVRPLRRTCHTPELPAAGKNYRIGNDWVSPELKHLWV